MKRLQDKRLFKHRKRPRASVSPRVIVTADVFSMQMIRWLSHGGHFPQTAHSNVHQLKNYLYWTSGRTWSRNERKVFLIIDQSFCHLSSKRTKNSFRSICKHTEGFRLCSEALNGILFNLQKTKCSINQCRKRLKSQTILIVDSEVNNWLQLCECFHQQRAAERLQRRVVRAADRKDMWV